VSKSGNGVKEKGGEYGPEGVKGLKDGRLGSVFEWGKGERRGKNPLKKKSKQVAKEKLSLAMPLAQWSKEESHQKDEENQQKKGAKPNARGRKKD